MLDENKKLFISYGNEKQIEFKQFVSQLFVILVLGLPGIVLFNNLLKVSQTIIIATSIFATINYNKNKQKKGMVTLYWGIESLCLGLISFVNAVGIWIEFVPNNVKLVSLICLICLYIIFGLLYLVYIRILVVKPINRKSKVASVAIGTGSFTMAGLLGMTGGKQFLHQLEQTQVILVILYGVALLSILPLFGTSNLLKYYYIKKYRDVLEEDLRKSLQKQKNNKSKKSMRNKM